MDGSSDRDTVLMTCHVVLPGDSTQNDLFFSVERGTELSLTETAGHNEAFELVLTDTFFSLRTFNSPHLYVCAGGTEEEDATLSAGGSPGELFVLSKPTDSDNGRICLQLAPSASRSATPRFLAVQQDRVIVARKGLGNPFLQLTRVKDLQLEGWKRNWDRAVRKRAVTLSAASAVAGSTSTITSLSSADSESVEGDASSRRNLSFLRKDSSGNVLGESDLPYPYDVDDSQPLNFDEQERQRQKAISDFLRSEEEYLTALSLLNEVYVTPMYADLTAEDHQRIFGNITQLLSLTKLMSTELASREAKYPGGVRIFGDIFARISPELTSVYSKFCATRLEALDYLQRKLREPVFAELVEHQEAINGVTMKQLLNRPAQRVVEYQKLLTAIMKCTGPDHPDYPHLRRACTAAQSAVITVTQVIRDTRTETKMRFYSNPEHMTIPSEFLPEPDWQLYVQGREFKTEGMMKKYPTMKHKSTLQKTMKSGKMTARSIMDVWLLLFNDILLIAKKSGKAASVHYEVIAEPILLTELDIEGETWDDDLFQITYKGQCHFMRAGSLADKDNWIKLLSAPRRDRHKSVHVDKHTAMLF